MSGCILRCAQSKKNASAERVVDLSSLSYIVTVYDILYFGILDRNIIRITLAELPRRELDRWEGIRLSLPCQALVDLLTLDTHSNDAIQRDG